MTVGNRMKNSKKNSNSRKIMVSSQTAAPEHQNQYYFNAQVSHQQQSVPSRETKQHGYDQYYNDENQFEPGDNYSSQGSRENSERGYSNRQYNFQQENRGKKPDDRLNPNAKGRVVSQGSQGRDAEELYYQNNSQPVSTINSHRNQQQFTDRTHDKPTGKDIFSVNSTSHYLQPDASPTNPNSSRPANNAFQKNPKPLVSSKSQNDLKQPNVQKTTTQATPKDTNLSKQESNPSSRYRSPTPTHKKNDSDKALGKPPVNPSNVNKEESGAPKVINVKLNTSSRLDESSISNKSARSTSPHQGRLNGTPAFDKNKYSSKGSHADDNKINKSNQEPPTQKKVDNKSQKTQLRQEIQALTVNTNHAGGGPGNYSNNPNTNQGKPKPISITPKGASNIRPFQYTVSNLNNSQLSQRTNSNPKIAKGNMPNSSHSASILEDSYFKDSNDKRDKPNSHQDLRYKNIENSRDHRDDDEIFSIRRNSDERGSSRIISERNDPYDSYIQEEQEKIESPQFMKEESRKRQNFDYHNEEFKSQSEEEEYDDDEIEPIKVKLDLSAFAKSLQKPADQPVSNNSGYRFPSFQPNPQENNFQKNPFTSEYTDKGSKSAGDYERKPERPRYDQGPGKYQYTTTQGRESFQPDEFSRMLSKEEGVYKRGAEGNRNQNQREMYEDVRDNQFQAKENHYYEEDSNIIQKVQQDIKSLSNKMNETLSPNYSKNLPDNLLTKPNEIKGTQLNFKESNPVSTQAPTGEGSGYKSQAMKGLTENIKKTLGNGPKNDYYQETSNAPNNQKPRYPDQQNKKATDTSPKLTPRTKSQNKIK